MKIQKISFIFVLALILVFVAAGSLYANLPTRYFDNIQANGYAVVDGQEDANQLRVQGYSTQTTNLVTLEQSDGDDKVTVSNAGAVVVTTDAGTDLFNVLVGSAKIGNGSPSVAQNGEDLYVEGNIEVDGATRLDGTTEINGNVDADSISVAGNADLTTINNSGGTLALNDNVDITGTLQYGAANLYPLGYASVNQQVVCGTTELTESLEIEATGLTTVTYVIATQITTPASTGAFLSASDPTTSTFTLYSWEGDYTAGTTPVSAHWCAIGDQ